LSIQDTFRTIYRTKAWGDNGQPFCSGGGSRGSASDQYCTFVNTFIRDHQVRSVVDLGCGDFAIGRRIIEATGIDYTGIDIVPELIAYHSATVGDARVRFQCADITRDVLPAADLCLVRQVLQHLSNEEIALALRNLAQLSSMMLISEDVPRQPRSFNRDKRHGPDVRSYHGSGVYVDEAPFWLSAVEVSVVPLGTASILRTVVFDPRSVGRKDA
jgi:SAM-dependent methyltransferase